MAQKLTVVTRATGKQGGAVVRGLLKRGHKVRAITRDPSSSQAKLLADAGAALVAAPLEDAVATRRALEGATSLFAITVPSGGTDAEIRQGIAAADAAKTAGVHLVFTSVASARQAFRTSTASTRSKNTSPKWRARKLPSPISGRSPFASSRSPLALPASVSTSSTQW
jgi:uncharacterized protein YbjT (DUF2867 family)